MDTGSDSGEHSTPPDGTDAGKRESPDREGEGGDAAGPAVSGSDDGAGDSLRPAVRRRGGDRTLRSAAEDDSGGVEADGLIPTPPPEREAVDIENAAFVLLGVVLVVGWIVLAAAGF